MDLCDPLTTILYGCFTGAGHPNITFGALVVSLKYGEIYFGRYLITHGKGHISQEMGKYTLFSVNIPRKYRWETKEFLLKMLQFVVTVEPNGSV